MVIARVAPVEPLRVLIVDDHRPSMVAMTVGLLRRGFVCQGAASSVAALDVARSFLPNIALVEWQLGRGEGVGLPRKLRAAVEAHSCLLAVVALSTQDEPTGFCERERVDAYYVKPIDVGAIAPDLVTAARGCRGFHGHDLECESVPRFRLNAQQPARKDERGDT